MVQLVSTTTPPRPLGRARQIYRDLREQIAAGVYGACGLLPSSRALAAELGVSRTTVTAAYEQLAAEGFIHVRQGARPRVMQMTAPPAPDTSPRRGTGPPRLSHYGARLRAAGLVPETPAGRLVADFRYGHLAREDFPAAVWRKAVMAAMARSSSRLAYGDPRGPERLRQALQAYLWRARTIRCRPEQIILVNGSQQGLDLCARLLLDAGDDIVIENPCYAMASTVFRVTGARPTPVAVDASGLDTDRLGGIAARLAYVTPSHQYPLGRVLPVGRRQDLLAWARQAGAYVIEDDYDAEYRYDIDPVPPLHALGDGSDVIYLGTVSKTLSPDLRIGYLVVPDELADLFAAAKRLTDRHTSAVLLDALTGMLESGAYERHVRRMRRRNAERRRALLDALHRHFGPEVAIEGADAGLHIVAWFGRLPSATEHMFIAAARLRGVGVYPVSPLYDPADPTRLPEHAGLVMGYSALDTGHIERGIQRLRDAFDECLP